MTSSAKPEPEVHNGRQRRTESRPQVTSTEIFVKFGLGIWSCEICDRTDRHSLHIRWLQYFAHLTGRSNQTASGTLLV